MQGMLLDSLDKSNYSQCVTCQQHLLNGNAPAVAHLKTSSLNRLTHVVHNSQVKSVLAQLHQGAVSDTAVQPDLTRQHN